MGSPVWGLGPSPFGEGLYSCDILPFWITDLGVCVLPMLHLCTSYLSHSGFLFMSLVVETLSVSLQVVVNNSCSVSVSNFGVSTGRSKLGVLLLLRFDHLLCMCLYI